MPVHEYRCRPCGARFERLYRKISDVPVTSDLSCPRCGGQVRRMVGTASLGGHVDVGVGRAAWPGSWEGTQSGNPELLHDWRRRVERETRDEERNPEVATLRQANAVRRYEDVHGPGSAQAAGTHAEGHGHEHAWTAVPFVAPTRNQS